MRCVIKLQNIHKRWDTLYNSVQICRSFICQFICTKHIPCDTV